MTRIADGLDYRHLEWHESKVHLLTIDLTKRSLRPVLAATAFPFLKIFPVIEAVEQGALAAVGGGFNVVWAHGFGYADQPLHAMVIDREIWTDGVGAGGYGVLLGEHRISTQQNRITVVVWRPDGTSFEVDRINRGHDGKVNAFTLRGGTNQHSLPGHHYTALGQPGWWTPDDKGKAQHRTMTVA